VNHAAMALARHPQVHGIDTFDGDDKTQKP
jgi:hypothetical protein